MYMFCVSLKCIRLYNFLSSVIQFIIDILKKINNDGTILNKSYHHLYLLYLETIKFFNAFSRPFTVNGNILNSLCIIL